MWLQLLCFYILSYAIDQLYEANCAIVVSRSSLSSLTEQKEKGISISQGTNFDIFLWIGYGIDGPLNWISWRFASLQNPNSFIMIKALTRIKHDGAQNNKSKQTAFDTWNKWENRAYKYM